MIRQTLALVLALSSTSVAPVVAQTRPATVEVYPIAETARLGTAIWRQDVAAARATDALLAASGRRLRD